MQQMRVSILTGPDDDAVARLVAEEEAMMEMTEDGPYRAVL